MGVANARDCGSLLEGAEESMLASGGRAFVGHTFTDLSRLVPVTRCAGKACQGCAGLNQARNLPDH